MLAFKAKTIKRVITRSCGHNEALKAKLWKVLETVGSHLKGGREPGSVAILKYNTFSLCAFVCDLGRRIASLNVSSLQLSFFNVVIMVFLSNFLAVPFSSLRLY